MEGMFGDMGPPDPRTREEQDRDKCSRRCNVCGAQLNVNSPNWFQCSEACRSAAWEVNHPRRDDE